MSSNCDACGKKLKVGDFGELIGMRISVHDTSHLLEQEEASERRKMFVEAMAPYHLFKNYNVCFPCLLKALNVKP